MRKVSGNVDHQRLLYSVCGSYVDPSWFISANARGGSACTDAALGASILRLSVEPCHRREVGSQDMGWQGRLCVIAASILALGLCAAGPQSSILENSRGTAAHIDAVAATRSHMGAHILDLTLRATHSQEKSQQELRTGHPWRRKCVPGSPEGTTKFFLFGAGAIEAVDLLCRNRSLLPTKFGPVHGWTVTPKVSFSDPISCHSRASNDDPFSACWVVVGKTSRGLYLYAVCITVTPSEIAACSHTSG